MAAQTTHLVSKTQSCEFGAALRESGWEIRRIRGASAAGVGWAWAQRLVVVRSPPYSV